MRKIIFILFIIIIASKLLMSYEIVKTIEGEEYIALQISKKHRGFIKCDLLNGESVNISKNLIESITEEKKYIEIQTFSKSLHQGEILSFDQNTINIGIDGFSSTLIVRDKIEKVRPIDFDDIDYIKKDDVQTPNKLTTQFSNQDVLSSGNTKERYHAVGVTLGTPGGINFVACGYTDLMMIKFDFGILPMADLNMGTSIGVGLPFYQNYKYSISTLTKLSLIYQYSYQTLLDLGFVIEFNISDFYIELGPSLMKQIEYDDIAHKENELGLSFMVQIGYVVRFNKLK
jgi:hypothetical protein